MCVTYCSSESPPSPIRANMVSGSKVTVITVTFAVMGKCSHISSGYPTKASSTQASTVFRTSSRPPNSLPESV